MYSHFILRPSLNVYTRDFTINNSEFIGRPALFDGEYTLLAIESDMNKDVTKSWVNKQVAKRHIVNESELVNSQDYCGSFFTKRRYTMASYSNCTNEIKLFLHKDKYKGILDLIVNKLRGGYLALMNDTRVNPFLGFYFLDRLIYKEDRC